MKILVLFAIGIFSVQCAPFEWHDTVRLHQQKDHGKEDEDITSANIKDHLYEANHKPLPKGTHIGQGDILFRPGEEEKLFQTGTDKLKRDGIRNERRRWPGAVVPYVIQSANGQAYEALQETIKEFNEKTCIRLVERTNQRDYVRMIAGGGCYSYIGRIGGSQDLSIGNGCEYKSTVVHEFVHALGFFHEQSRPDRDNFITIVTENIINGFVNQFEKESTATVTTFNQPYDYVSVMHYSRTAFSKDRQRLATIIPKNNPNQQLGQLSDGGLSEIDVSQLNAMYNCQDTTQPPSTEPPTQSTTQPPTQPPTTTKKPTIGLTKAKCVRRMQYCVSSMNKCRRLWLNE